MQENTNQENPEYGHFSRSDIFALTLVKTDTTSLDKRELRKKNNNNTNVVPDQMSISDYSHCPLCMTSLGLGPVRQIDSSGHLAKISC